MNRLTRLTHRKQWGELIADRLAAIGHRETAAKLRRCTEYLERTTYRLPDGSHTERLRSSERCQNRLCQVCASKRAAQTAARYEQPLERFSAGRYGSHLVLTLKNSEHLPERKTLAKYLRNLWRRSIWKKYGGIDGGLYSIETTYNAQARQFHAHIHCLIFTRHPVPSFANGRNFWTQEANQEVADAWLSITGDSFIVRGQQWDGRTHEMTKYVAKGSDLSAMPKDQLAEYVAWTHGQRMLSSFGKLYGLAAEIERELEATDTDEADEYPHAIPADAQPVETLTLQWDRATYQYIATNYEAHSGKAGRNAQLRPDRMLSNADGYDSGADRKRAPTTVGAHNTHSGLPAMPVSNQAPADDDPARSGPRAAVDIARTGVEL